MEKMKISNDGGGDDDNTDSHGGFCFCFACFLFPGLCIVLLYISI